MQKWKTHRLNEIRNAPSIPYHSEKTSYSLANHTTPPALLMGDDAKKQSCDYVTFTGQLLGDVQVANDQQKDGAQANFKDCETPSVTRLAPASPH